MQYNMRKQARFKTHVTDEVPRLFHDLMYVGDVLLGRLLRTKREAHLDLTLHMGDDADCHQKQSKRP